MSKLILTVGASASGKSTWSDEVCQSSNIKQVNRDDIRFELFTGGVRDWTKYKFNKTNEQEVTTRQLRLADNYAAYGHPIIVSDTNLNSKYRLTWRKWAENYGYEYEEKAFPCDWDTLVKRNNQRYGGISQSILWKQYLDMNDYLCRDTYEPDESKPKAFLCDIDGTVADMTDVRGPFDWKKVGQDKPRSVVISMITSLIEDGLTPIFLSGRDGSCSEDTYDWLMGHIMQWYLPENGGFHLFMRTEGDQRKDAVVKEELFWKYVANNFNVVASVDDRPCMIRLWNELKIPNVIAVADPLKEF